MKRHSVSADTSDGVAACKLRLSECMLPEPHSSLPDTPLQPIGGMSSSFDCDISLEELLPALDESIFQYLPDSLFLHIIQYCDPKTLLCSVRLVCKRWLLLCRDTYAWRHQRIRGTYRIQDSQILPVLQYATNLRCLDVSDCSSITSQGLAVCLRFAPNLRELKVERCLCLNEVFFDAVATHCPRLESLLADTCKKISNANICRISQNNHLKVLNVAQCSQLTDFAIESLSTHCIKLTDLCLSQCNKVSDYSLEVIGNTLTHLKKFELSNLHRLSPSGIMNIVKLRNLEKLDLSLTSTNEDNIRELTQGCPRLMYLNLSICAGINDTAVAYIARGFTKMQTLILVANDISNASLVSLANNSMSLVELDIGWCQGVQYEGVKYLVTKLSGRLKALGLIRCDNVVHSEVNELVQAYPQLKISTLDIDLRHMLHNFTVNVSGTGSQVTPMFQLFHG